jgi:hypothetical protein
LTLEASVDRVAVRADSRHRLEWFVAEVFGRLRLVAIGAEALPVLPAVTVEVGAAVMQRDNVIELGGAAVLRRVLLQAVHAERMLPKVFGADALQLVPAKSGRCVLTGCGSESHGCRRQRRNATRDRVR